MILSQDKNKKHLLTGLLTFVLSLLIISISIPNSVYAVDVDDGGGSEGISTVNIDSKFLGSIGPLIARVVNLAAWGIGGVFIIMILITAIKYAMAQGDPKGLEGAKNTLTYAIFGFLVAIGFFAISSIITRALGITDQSLITSPGSAVQENVEGLLEYLKNIESPEWSFESGASPNSDEEEPTLSDQVDEFNDQIDTDSLPVPDWQKDLLDDDGPDCHTPGSPTYIPGVPDYMPCP